LEKLYKDPEDVDLFVALTLEDKYPGALVGRVSACLLTKQFQNLCEGDRFCVTHKHSFTNTKFLKSGVISLLYLVCKNVDIQQVPLFPFTPPSETNPLIDCSIFNKGGEIVLTESAPFPDGSTTYEISLQTFLDQYLTEVSIDSTDNLAITD